MAQYFTRLFLNHFTHSALPPLPPDIRWREASSSSVAGDAGAAASGVPGAAAAVSGADADDSGADIFIFGVFFVFLNNLDFLLVFCCF